MLLRSVVAIIPLLLSSALPAHAIDKTPADLVFVQTGTLPIILTAPHGGREAVPDVAPRNVEGKPRGGSGYETHNDTNTDILARGIAAEMKALTGQDAYLVVAKFQRRYIDANRPSEIGLDSPLARPYYDYYHQSIRHMVDEIRKNYSAGLLIDVHGRVKDPGLIIRGTQNGRSIKGLLARAGVSAVTGHNGIFGQLEINGFTIFPRNNVPPSGTSEDSGFKGGYTLSIYGSHTANGIDAVQFEFRSKYREKAMLDISAKNAGKAIVALRPI